MAAISRPAPDAVVKSAHLAMQNFASKCQTDPKFNNFIGENDNKITKLYMSIDAILQSMADPDKREVFIKVLNGPIQVIFSRPSQECCVSLTHIEAVNERQPLNEQEFQDTIRDWCVRAVTFSQNYIMTTPLKNVQAMLDASEGIEGIISQSVQGNRIGFELKA
jgi:hypothetical protein